MTHLFERRERVPTEPRVEILTAYDNYGNETWEDEQDYLDRILIIPDALHIIPDALQSVTLREFKDICRAPSAPLQESRANEGGIK